MRNRDRLVFGVVIPIAVLIVGMLFLASLDSKASAAGFGGLAVFFMLIITLPVTIALNLILLARDVDTRRACFGRGMVIPGIVLVAGIVYQTGLWDQWT